MAEDKRTQTKKKVSRKSPDRAPRETRVASERPSDAWVPAATLPVPDPQDGYTFRWVRTSTFDQQDNKNVSQKMREGWVPVRAEDHPELQVRSDLNSQFEGNVEVGGLLLCKAPTEWVEKRREYYDTVSQQQMRAVDESFMRENDPRMSKFSDKQTRTSFGDG